MNRQMVFLHAPSILEQGRALPSILGDSVDEEGYFGRIPVGFFSLSNYLSERGWDCRILNLASRLAKSGYSRTVSELKQINADVVGIDIHWLLHAPGALKAAGLLKSHHPATKIVLGGFSATYFHEELIKCDAVDYVVRGESTELPLYELLCAIEKGAGFEDVPNLTWKDGEAYQVNPLSYRPDFIEVDYSYKQLFKNMLKHRDFRGSLPAASDWLSSFSGIITCRGCTCRCANCGGSNFSLGRTSVVKRSAEQIVNEAVFAQNLTPSKAQIMLFGDIRMGDEADIITGLAGAKIANPLRYELFWPANDLFLNKLAGTTRKLRLSFSAESHDEQIRRSFGKDYSNREMEQMIEAALGLGADFTLFFMIGLPFQSVQSVRETYDYCEYLMDQYARNKPGRLVTCIHMLAPYLDPGSPAFLKPEEHGYRLFYRSLSEHLSGLCANNPVEILNYETVAMSREEIFTISYEMARKVTRLQEKHALCSPGQAKKKLRWLEKEQAQCAKRIHDYS